MEYDVAGAIGAVVREVRRCEHDGKPAQAVIASREYATGIADLWEAITHIERIPRWFAPVSGELKLGGRYQIEGNASGTVTTCDPPGTFALTWEFSGNTSWVSVKLTSINEDTTHLELEHLAHVDPAWETQYGPGATGVGWEPGLLGLGQHIDTGAALPPEASTEWMASDNYKDFVRASSEGWRAASVASGTDAGEAAAAAANTAAFYTGEPPPGGS